MRKRRFLLLAAGLPLTGAALFAQTPGNSFQQPAWIGPPGSSKIPTHTFAAEAQSGPVTGRPVSGTEIRRTVQTLADGTHVEDSSTSGFYRDAMGRMRSESPSKVLIYDPVGGFIYTLDTRVKQASKDPIRQNSKVSIVATGNRTSVSTSSSSTSSPSGNSTQHGNDPMALSKAAARATREAQMSRVQTATEDLPPQMVNGIYCRGSRVTETIPAGTFGNDRDVKVVSERWYSDDLQLLVKTSNSDPRFGVSTYELTNTSQAPPDPSLFQVPADYTVKQQQVFEVHGGYGPVHH